MLTDDLVVGELALVDQQADAVRMLSDAVARDS